jgi:uncharacterized membrane protein YhaH (DUF805 family)
MKCLSCGNQIKDHEPTCRFCGAANLTYNIKEKNKSRKGKRKAPKPRYGLIGFLRMYLHTFDFDGAVSRSEYWNNKIICYVIMIPAIYFLVIYGFNYRLTAAPSIVTYMDITFIWFILSIVTFTSHDIRRLHDAGYSGDYLRLKAVPNGLWIVLKIFCSPYRSNRFSDELSYDNHEMKEIHTIADMIKEFREFDNY